MGPSSRGEVRFFREPETRRSDRGHFCCDSAIFIHLGGQSTCITEGALERSPIPPEFRIACSSRSRPSCQGRRARRTLIAVFLSCDVYKHLCRVGKSDEDVCLQRLTLKSREL